MSSGYRCMQPIICPPVCGKIGFFALAPPKKTHFRFYFRAKKRPACRIRDGAQTHFLGGKQCDLQKKNSFLLGEKINLAFFVLLKPSDKLVSRKIVFFFSNLAFALFFVLWDCRGAHYECKNTPFPPFPRRLFLFYATKGAAVFNARREELWHRHSSRVFRQPLVSRPLRKKKGGGNVLKWSR